MSSGRFVVSPHFRRWAVRDLGYYDADSPTYEHRWQAEAAASRKNGDNAARHNPTPTLFDKDETMTQPNIWDELDGGDFRRDDSGRPLIIPVDGGEPVAYSRCTSYISAVEDDYGIQQWKRNLAIDGILAADELRHQWAVADWHGKAAIAQTAFVKAGGEVKADRGTRMHTLTDHLDKGEALPPTVAPAEHADLAAYRAAVAHLTLVHAEVKVVHDGLKVAGTPDRVWNHHRWPHPRIGDLKTGKPDPRKWAMQMALYAHSKLYDVATGERTLLEVDQNVGIIVHLPYGEAKARIIEVDLAAGWQGVLLCQRVHGWRTHGMRDLCKVLPAEPVVDIAPDTLLLAIGLCHDADALRALWTENKTAWTDEHTAAAKARSAALGQAQAAA